MTGGESKLRKAIVEVVLRKHGIILKDWNAVDPRLIVIESDDDLRDLDPPRDAVVINGPCASGALEALGIRFRRSDQDGVTLKSGDVTYVLESPRFELRQPTKYSKWKAPQGEIQPPLPTSDRMPLVVFEASEDHAVPLLGKIERAGEGGWQPVCLDTPLGLVFGIDLHGLFLSSHRVPRLLCGFSRRADQSRPELFEAFFVHQLVRLLKRKKVPFAIANPWPDDKRWCFSIRHDYDRLITDEEIHNILTLYNRLCVRSSWYFLPHKRITHQARLIQDMGHEIGLHTTATSESQFRDQLSVLEISAGTKVTGVTAHGGDYIGFLGATQYEWAEAAGLDYSEGLGFVHHRPFCLPGTGPRGALTILPSHSSFDLGTKPGQFNLKECEGAIEQRRRGAGAALLMNHPDLHSGSFLHLVSSQKLRDAWCPTSAELARWARAYSRTKLRFEGDAVHLDVPQELPFRMSGIFRIGESEVAIGAEGSN